MLYTIEELMQCTVQLKDAEIDNIQDVYFDDAEWTVRHLVLNAGSLVATGQALISPHAVTEISARNKLIRLSVTVDQVKNAPGPGNDLPVSRQFETASYDYYGYPYYWTGPYAWGYWTYPVAGTAAVPQRQETTDELARRREQMDPHLRSFNTVNGYSVEGPEGPMGDIEDIIVDAETWRIRYVVVDTRKWLPGKDVLIHPESIEQIRWEDSTVYIPMLKDELRSQPEFKSVDEIVQAGETEVVLLGRAA